MNGTQPDRINCWEFLNCGRGPDAAEPCVAAIDQGSDAINGGTNAGRLCWAVVGTLSGQGLLAECARQTNCLECGFFQRVKSAEGPTFHLLKLARGVDDSQELQATITKIESLMAIHERLRSRFNLDETVRGIADEARKVTGAQRSLVLLLRGRPPALHGELCLKQARNDVVINLDEESAVGFAAVHNQMVNLRDIYGSSASHGVPAFNRSYDRQCRCRTNSFLAVPINDAEGRVIGVMTTANARKGFFSTDDEWFMDQYAIEVALAVEKQRLVQQSFSVLRLASIGETIAGLSHCIKNIAQALRIGSYVIERALKSGNIRDAKVAWEILDDHIDRLAELSMDVLAFDPALKDQSERAGPNKLLEHVVALLQEEARARAIQIRFEPGSDVESARFNAMGLYRCAVNLISNALDACPLSGGLVTVATRRTGEQEFMFTVSDNGRGMDEKTRNAIFEVFKSSKPRKGIGLGLPTVADIVNRQNGRIEVDSVPGRGTTFRIFIREDLAVV